MCCYTVRRPPVATRTYTPCPYTALFRCDCGGMAVGCPSLSPSKAGTTGRTIRTTGGRSTMRRRDWLIGDDPLESPINQGPPPTGTSPAPAAGGTDAAAAVETTAG